jgi:hypothetical protein
MTRARNDGESSEGVRLPATKNPFSSRFFVARRIAFAAFNRGGAATTTKDFASNFVARQVASDLCLTCERPALSNKAT